MTRDEQLEAVRDKGTWDIVVIGGGATGLGTALDAVARGYHVLLLEVQDFGQATSSRSTKLIHGGVRYLAQGNIHLVREALRERGLLLKNAPHLVHTREFVVPAFQWWERAYYGIGLTLYDWLSGSLGIGRSRIIDRADVLDRLPTLRRDGLRGGVSYFDGQFDDARLVIALMRTLQEQGGSALNYMEVTGLLKRNDRIDGVVVRDRETGESLTVKARCVVNATGVFADSIRQLDASDAPPMIRPSQGIHLVLDRSFLPGSSALMIPKTDDGRVLFVIPWHDRVLLGTTDTPVPKVTFNPAPLEEEVAYLLKHAARYLERAPSEQDVLSRFAGLRPLINAGSVRKTSRLSREHEVVVSNSGLVTITGGKWTTYRKMAEDAVDRAVAVAGLKVWPSRTSTVKLHGWTEPVPDVDEWQRVYGADLPAVEALIAGRDDLGLPIHSRLPFRRGEVIWAARYESARTVEDVLARRLRTLFLDAKGALESAPLVASLLAEELGRDSSWCDAQVREFATSAKAYLPA